MLPLGQNLAGQTPMAETLYEKLWQDPVVHQEAEGTALIDIDRHLIHEVTSAQAFEGLRLAGPQTLANSLDRRYRAKGWTRFFAPPASNGASPAVR